MTGSAVAALALAAAVLIPASPRCRLGAAAPARRRPALLGAACCAVVGAAAVGVFALPATAGLAAGLAVATLGLRRRRRNRRRRGMAEGGALESALGVLVGELRAGAHPVRAFEAAAAESNRMSVAAALRAVAARARLGADVPAGLRSVAAASALPAMWELLAVYWQLGGDHGLPISALMNTAQRDVAERQRFSTRVDAGMAGARTSAAILAALPVLGVLLGQLIGAQPIRFLLGGAGGAVLPVGVALVCAGLLWSDRITGRLT